MAPKYCVVFGCKNTSKAMPDLNFLDYLKSWQHARATEGRYELKGEVGIYKAAFEALSKESPFYPDHSRKLPEHIRTKPTSDFLAKPPLSRYDDLPLPANRIIASYIWIDETGENLRYKTRTLKYVPKVTKDKLHRILDDMNEKYLTKLTKDITGLHETEHMAPYYAPVDMERVLQVACKQVPGHFIYSFDENYKELPVWNCDGNASGSAPRFNSDIFMVPRAIYNDPFLGGKNILVMCDTYKGNMQPTDSNQRKKCQNTYDKCIENEPWFSFGQEFILFDTEQRPLGWPRCGIPGPIGPYYCGVSAKNIIARDLIDAHYRCCLYAGVPISGTVAEKTASQWEFQVGPSLGVSAGDDLWMARYILQRLAEEYGAIVSFDPKPIPGWNGSGAHANFSTKKMRLENGIIEIENAIFKLSKSHMKHIAVYDPHGGKDNERRLTGKNETAGLQQFTAGVANRNYSIMLPRHVAEQKKGYLKDHRPAANSDPYAVSNILMTTCVLNR